MNREAPSAPAAPLAASELLALVPGLGGCTPRQLDVAGWLREGKTCSEIARILGMSHRTVEAHLHVIYEELGVEGAASAAAAIHHAIEDHLRAERDRALAEVARLRKGQRYHAGRRRAAAGQKITAVRGGARGPSRTAV